MKTKKKIEFIENITIVWSSAERAFLYALYKDNYFERANEIHFRLGLIYQELDEFELALRHFKLALIDSSASASSVSKAESNNATFLNKSLSL